MFIINHKSAPTISRAEEEAENAEEISLILRKFQDVPGDHQWMPSEFPMGDLSDDQ